LLLAAALMRAATKEMVARGYTHVITDVFEDDVHSPLGFHTRAVNNLSSNAPTFARLEAGPRVRALDGRSRKWTVAILWGVCWRMFRQLTSHSTAIAATPMVSICRSSS
jgi:hypothetical protein